MFHLKSSYLHTGTNDIVSNYCVIATHSGLYFHLGPYYYCYYYYYYYYYYYCTTTTTTTTTALLLTVSNKFCSYH